MKPTIGILAAIAIILVSCFGNERCDFPKQRKDKINTDDHVMH